MPLIDVPTVHAVTDDETLKERGFTDRASAILRAFGSHVAVHLRSRDMPAGRLMAIAERLVGDQEASGGWLVVNDRVDVALATRARGVQLGSSSLTVADVRRLAAHVQPRDDNAQPGDARLRIGASVHAPEEAMELVATTPPDWVIAGNVFETASHADRPARGVAFARAVAASRLATIVIGGVRPEHVPELRAAGAHGVAAIRGIWNARDPVHAVQLYLSSYVVC